MYHGVWHVSNGTGIDTRAGITSGQPTVCIAVNTWLVACMCNSCVAGMWRGVVVVIAICSGLCILLQPLVL